MNKFDERQDSRGKSVISNKFEKQTKTFKSLNSLIPVRKTNSSLTPNRKKVSSLHKLELFADNISLITNAFLSCHPNKKKVKLFTITFANWMKGTYIDLLLLLRQFSDFNIFDHINIPTTYNEKMTSKEIYQRTEMISIRNNILLSILVVANELQWCEKTGEMDFGQKEPLFSDLSFLNPLIEKFKTLIIDIDGHYNVTVDVELFFLAILDYKDKARIIKQKFSQYFKDLLFDCNIAHYNFDHFLNIAIDKQSFLEYKDEEVILIRRIFRNAALRNFYFGIEHLMRNPEYCYLLAEGRIWKSIGMKMQPFYVYNLWVLYDIRLEDICNTDLRETLAIEYEEKIKELNKKLGMFTRGNQINDEYNKLLYKRKILETEISLYCVTCLKELIVIFFKNDLKELVLYFFNEYFNSNGDQKIPIEIFEICLDYDEDISIDIVDNSLSSSTVTKCHMEIALIKKYFRLARRLLKYPQCRNILSLSPPNSDNYLVFLSKLQVYQKKQMVEKIKFQKGDTDLKIIDYIQDNNTMNDSMENGNGTSIHHGDSGKQEESLINKIAKEKINVQLKQTVTFVENLYPAEKIPNRIIETDSKINFLNLKENEELFGSLNRDEQYKNQNQLQNGQPNQNAFNNPTIGINSVQPSRFSNNQILNVNRVHASQNNLLEPKTPTLLNPFKMHSSKKLSFNKNNFEDPLTPKSKFSVVSSTHLNENKQDLNQLEKTKTDDIKLEKIKNENLQINVQMLLIDQLRYGQYAFDALCLLSSIHTKSINPDYGEKICSYLLVYTTNEDAITKCSEPLLLIALAAELLYKIAKINQKIKYKAETVAMEILILGGSIQSSMKDEDMLNFYLKEQCDHNGRSALEIYAENRFYNLLSDLNVGSIVGKLWFGSGLEQSIYKFLRMTRIMVAHITKEHYDPMVKNDYLPTDSVYSFQFYQYINNCSVRFFFESFSVIAITILYQFIIYSYVTFTKEVNELHPPSHYYHITNLIANSLMCCSILNYLFLLLYFYKTGRKLKLNIYELVINIILLLAIILNFINLPEILFPVQSNVDTNILFDGVIFSVILVMSWMKVIVILMSTNTYGPFLRIMFNVFWQVVSFLIIVFCITFLFAQCFTMFFKNSNSDFIFFYNGFITLFNTAFGQCNFDKFVDLQIFGFVSLITYTTLSNIMLFNLIVAIINNLFNNLEDKADAENRAVLVLTHERLKWDERYGLLILLPTPLNAISLFFIPFLLLLRDSVTYWNLLFSKICYFFVAIIIFVFLFFIGIISYPLALVKSLIHSSYDAMMVPGYRKIGIIALSLVTRPFILFGYLGTDFYLFWKLLYKEPVRDLTKDETGQYIRRYIIALRKVLNEARYKEKKKILPINELYTKLCLFKKKTKDPLASLISKIERVDSGSSSNSKKSKEIQDSSSKKNNFSLSLNQSGKFRMQEEMKLYFRQLIDKVVDPEGFVDVERTLLILPDRVKYCDSFVKNIKNMNIRVFIRGMTKYFFFNAISNPIYSYKKLQLLVYKVMIKFKMIYSFIPEKTLKKINKNFQTLNENPQFMKTVEALKKFEERDDVSEYDDEGEYAHESIHIESHFKSTLKSLNQPNSHTSSISNLNMTGEASSDDNS